MDKKIYFPQVLGKTFYPSNMSYYSKNLETPKMNIQVISKKNSVGHNKLIAGSMAFLIKNAIQRGDFHLYIYLVCNMGKQILTKGIEVDLIYLYRKCHYM